MIVKSSATSELNNKKMETHEYKIDTGNDHNLIPIRMYKMPFLQTNITELNLSTDTNTVLHAYNNSCIPEKRVCRITIMRALIFNAVSLQCQEMEQHY